MRKELVATALGAVIVLAPVSALAATPQSAKATRQAVAPTSVNWQIPLKAGPAYPRATGTSQYQTQPGQRELQVEVERLASLRGKSVVVRVNGAVVGSMKVSGKGIAQLTRNTERAQRVPVITHGSTVAVKTTTGIGIASGRF